MAGVAIVVILLASLSEGINESKTKSIATSNVTTFQCCTDKPLSSVSLRSMSPDWCFKVNLANSYCLVVHSDVSYAASLCDKTQTCSATASTHSLNQGVWKSLLVLLSELDKQSQQKTPNVDVCVCVSAGLELSINCSETVSGGIAFIKEPDTSIFFRINSLFSWIQITMELASCRKSQKNIYRGTRYLTHQDLQGHNIHEWLEVHLRHQYNQHSNTHSYQLTIPAIPEHNKLVHTSDNCKSFVQYRIQMKDSSVWNKTCNTTRNWQDKTLSFEKISSTQNETDDREVKDWPNNSQTLLKSNISWHERCGGMTSWSDNTHTLYHTTKLLYNLPCPTSLLLKISTVTVWISVIFAMSSLYLVIKLYL